MIDELLEALFKYYLLKAEYEGTYDMHDILLIQPKMQKHRERAELKLNEIIDARIKAHLQEQTGWTLIRPR